MSFIRKHHQQGYCLEITLKNLVRKRILCHFPCKSYRRQISQMYIKSGKWKALVLIFVPNTNAFAFQVPVTMRQCGKLTLPPAHCLEAIIPTFNVKYFISSNPQFALTVYLERRRVWQRSLVNRLLESREEQHPATPKGWRAICQDRDLLSLRRNQEIHSLFNFIITSRMGAHSALAHSD